MPLPSEYKDVFSGRELKKRAANGALIYGEVLCCSSLESMCYRLKDVLIHALWCRRTI